MSGADDAASIAEKKKLESQLYEAKESLSDTYYDHAKDQQSQALDDEAKAFEDSMTNYIENLRNKLEESTNDIQSFIENVTGVVVLNAGTVQETYENTGLAIDNTLMEPWVKAAAEIEKFGGAEGALALMNSWTESKEGAPFYDFENAATKYLRSPWTTAKRFATLFSKTVSNVMTKVVENIKSNVSTSLEELQKVEAEIKKINDTEIKVTGGTNGGDTGGGDTGGGDTGGGDTGGNDEKETKTKPMQYVGSLDKTLVVGDASYLNKNTVTIDGVKYYAQKRTDNKGNSLTTWYYPISKVTDVTYDGGRSRGKGFKAGTPYYRYYGGGSSRNKDKVTPNKDKVALYAKGTIGTKKDQWAITDEIGDELTLVPGKDGNLSFLRKGTGVVPADLTKRLFELAQMPTNELIDNNIIKPLITNVETKNQALSVNFEALVKAETITSDVLPEVEKMVSKQLDAFTKKLNYALKRV